MDFFFVSSVERFCRPLPSFGSGHMSTVSYVRFPPFRCRSSVAVSSFPLAVAAAVAYSICMPSLVDVDDWLASYGTTATEKIKKIELDPISIEERLRQLFAVYGCNQRNFLT